MKFLLFHRNVQILVLILFVCLISCKPAPEKTRSIDPAFTSYITAFTSGQISKQSGIRIRLAEDYPEVVNINQPLEEKLFQFSPHLKGNTYWIDNRTIEFRPYEDMKSGTHYEASFFLNKLFNVADNLKNFYFDFQTITQNIDVRLGGHQAYDPKNLKWLRMSGTMLSADILQESETEPILHAKQDSRKLNIHWDNDAEGKTHYFIIDSIERKGKEASVLLEWNGKSIGIITKGSQEIKIPALGDFKLMETSVVQHPEQYVLLRFSDPLQENQYLNGLINLDNGTDLTYAIENNEIRAYPAVRQTGNMNILVSSGICNILGYKLHSADEYPVSFEELKPAIRLLGKGTVLPSSEGLIFPFEAVNLKSVEIRIIHIFENNVSQFLQVNQLDGEYQLKRVGRLILKKTIRLNTGAPVDLGIWNAFSLDLAELIQAEPGAIYRVELGFQQKHSLYPCGDDGESEVPDELEEDYDDSYEQELSYWDSYENYYYDEGYYYYEWSERDNPCSASYYGKHRSVRRNILASNLGIIAKGCADQSMSVAVTDLRTTEPLSGVEIEIYNYQQQLIGLARTDLNGIAQLSLENNPFLLIAKLDDQRGYLRLDDGSSLSLSRFDVSGNVVQKGVKVFMYGERGVWRPGDTLFLSMMLEDKDKKLPRDHPVSLELLNPRGQLVKRMVRSHSSHGFYSFTISTHPEDPTGNWTALMKIGGLTFTKSLRIETVKPNRFKIALDFGRERLSVSDHSIQGTLKATWLHGAAAKNLRANVSVVVNPIKTKFEPYPDYVFDDPVRTFYSEEHTLFNDLLDNEGEANFSARIETGHSSPGMLNASFVSRVFEESGEFSIYRYSIPYSPYTGYVGIKTPRGDKARGMLLTDTSHAVNLVTVDVDGNPVSRNNLDVKVYKVGWRWWWDASFDNLASYVGSSSHEAIMDQKVNTPDGEGSFQFRVDYPEWGRYLIRVVDPVSGHASGEIVYIDWPGWAGRAQREQPGGAAMLSFSADKQNYLVGETAKISIPSASEGRALISIENGSRVLEAYWTETATPETRVDFKITPEMAPNVYVNVSLVQPHDQSENDLPIRLYGVIPILVENQDTRLKPIIEMPDVLRPEEKLIIKVSDQNNQECSYTLAIVDEGLLDLTRFTTPDPWNHFYAREALGVRTWDIYDAVLGAYGGKIEQIFGIGGGSERDEAGEDSQSRANRFKPMVRFIGPHELKKGQSNSHTLTMPNYIGSVRTMVIAGNQFAYGSAEKTTPVKKPLMVLATLPRVLGPAEQVVLPVTVFAMEKHIRNVLISVETNDLLKLHGENVQKVFFSETGDQVVNFTLDVVRKIGVGKVKVTAISGSESASYEIEIDVRNPNPPVTDFIEEVLEPAQSMERSYMMPGMAGTNTLMLEVSNIPPIDFGRRLKYLLSYPHGCVEQTTSAAFPQLFLCDVTEINEAVSEKTEKNVKSAIKSLQTFIDASGGFTFWPGSGEANQWVSSYAGHFLLEAEAKGYALPPSFKIPWLKYQKSEARKWKKSENKYRQSDLDQAYRLYTLALAGEPELGAMNRLRESGELSIQARWRLAAAYTLCGQTEMAGRLITSEIPEIPQYPGSYYTYGSRERDLAMILETLTLMKRRSEATRLARKISDELRSNRWMSTQTTAYCLLAMSKFAGSEGISRELDFTYRVDGGKEIRARTGLSIAQVNLEGGQRTEGHIKVQNNGQGILFVRLIMEGTPETGDISSVQNNLNMSVWYTDIQGNIIDVSSLKQGTDFLAHVTVNNPFVADHYKDMALTQVFPPGWEIHNVRMDESAFAHQVDKPTYQDIRDDRVYTYFDLPMQKSNHYVIQLNAAYQGRYYLPTVYCEAMYDETVNARVPGKWIKVDKPE